MNKKEDEDMDYGIQYFNAFQSLGFCKNDMIYYIWENEIVSSLCKPVKTKQLSKISGKWLRYQYLKSLLNKD